MNHRVSFLSSHFRLPFTCFEKKVMSMLGMTLTSVNR